MHTEESLRRRYAEIRARAQQLRTDADAWNLLHPNEDPIEVDLNFETEVRDLVSGIATEPASRATVRFIDQRCTKLEAGLRYTLVLIETMLNDTPAIRIDGAAAETIRNQYCGW